MQTIPAYEREPYQTSLEVEILTTGEDSAGGAFAVLDDTVLFPEGGGQPADRGHLGSIAVLDVQRLGGEIRHYLAAPTAAGPATLSLDWRRRFDHMQQHTAQHLVTAVALRLHGWRTTSFHLQPEVSDVELDVEPRQLGGGRLEALEEAINAEVRAARPVTTRRVTPEEYPKLGVRSRGLPDGHHGDIRLVEIAGVDLNTCGGTHLRSTAEIETVKLLDAEAARGGTRLRWIAGGRVRRRLAMGETRLAELRRLFDTADDNLAATAGLKLDQLKQASREVKRLTGQLAGSTAADLVNRRQAVTAEHFDGVDLGFLQQVALSFSNAAHPGAALLTATGPKGSFFAVAAGSECKLDVQEAGRRAAAMLDGRGGGSGRIFQGKAATLKQREQTLEALRSMI